MLYISSKSHQTASVVFELIQKLQKQFGETRIVTDGQIDRQCYFNIPPKVSSEAQKIVPKLAVTPLI